MHGPLNVKLGLVITKFFIKDPIVGTHWSVAYPGIVLGGGGSTNSVEDRENGDLGVVAP